MAHVPIRTMPRATILLSSALPYRRDCFVNGLARLGYSTDHRAEKHPEPGDVLVIWNRKEQDGYHALRYERAGATVLVAENGYIGKAPDGGKLYALAIGQHNGAGKWRVGGPERIASQMATGWHPFGLELKPWRERGDGLLMLPQRGIGCRGVAMAAGWAPLTERALARVTNRPIRTRRHPGAEKVEPYADFAGLHAVVTWGSGAAIKAIVAGIPAFHGLPSWIGAPAALPIGSDIEAPFMGDRMPMLERLAWAQWSLAEISTGEPFAWLLQKNGAHV